MREHPRTKRLTHGLAGDGVYVDDVMIKPKPLQGDNGVSDWLGDRVLYIGFGFVRSCLPDGSDDRQELIDGQPIRATFVRACGDRDWASFHWDAEPANQGVKTTWGLRLPKAVLLDGSADGGLLVGDDYQAGDGISAYQVGSTAPVWQRNAARPECFHPYPQASMLDKGTACWTERGSGSARVVKAFGLPSPVPELPWIPYHPTLCRVGGQVWLTTLRTADDAVIAVPWNFSGKGITFRKPATEQAQYGPLGTPGPDGQSITIRWSRTPGEWADTIAKEVVGVTSLAAIAPPPEPVPASPPPPPQAIPLAITIPAYGQGGAAPYLLSASYEVTGASGPLEVELTIDDAPAARATAVSGTLTVSLPNPGTYRLGARVMNQGRSAKTGMQRLVTVTAAEPVPLQPPSADALDLPLEGLATLTNPNWTQVLTRIVAAIRLWATRANDGEPMTDEQLATAMYRVVVEASKWKTLRAALMNAWPAGDPSPGEMSRAVADVLVMVAYRELLFREPDPFGLDYYGSRLADGRMTDASMRSDIMESEEYRLLHVPVTPVAPTPMAPLTLPVLSIVGRQFRNGNALYIPRWVSGLTLLVRTSADQLAFLDWATRTGFNGVRVFAGALTWAGQSPELARAALPALLEQAASRGLVVEVTAITDSATGYDAKAHLNAVAAILAGRRGVVLELANEIGHPTQSADITAERLRQWGQEIATPRGLLWALGAASTDEPIDNVYAANGGRYCTAHLDRGRPSWNNVRRVREIYAIVESHGVPAINNEPMGADELDGSQTGKQRWNDPALFFTLGALDRAFGVGGVHHSQAGLMAQVPGPVQQQCAEAYVAGHAGVETVLPGVVGQYKNVGHAGGPFSGARFVEGGSEDGVVRAYSFVDGARGVTVLVGARGDAGLVWMNGWRQVRELAKLTAKDGRYAAVLEIAR